MKGGWVLYFYPSAFHFNADFKPYPQFPDRKHSDGNNSAPTLSKKILPKSGFLPLSGHGL